MFLENFNPEDPKDLERLFDYLDKDKFNSLSFDEQDELLDFLIDCTNGKMFGSNHVTALGLMKDDMHGLDMNEIINHVGKDKFKEMIRNAILNGQLHMNTVSSSDVEDILEKLKNGKASKQDMMLLNSIVKSKTGHGILDSKEQRDVEFSTFAILKAYCTYFDFEDPDGDNMFIRDIEPFISAAFCIAMASAVSDEGNPLGKMFNKHGYFKVQKDVIDLTLKLSDLIVEYSKEHLIAPEKTFVALLNVLKILSGPMNLSLDNYDADKLEDVLFHIMFAETEKSHQEEKLDDIIKEAILDEEDEEDDDEDQAPVNQEIKNENPKPLANANNKESNTKVDIRKLLLDD